MLPCDVTLPATAGLWGQLINATGADSPNVHSCFELADGAVYEWGDRFVEMTFGRPLTLTGAALSSRGGGLGGGGSPAVLDAGGRAGFFFLGWGEALTLTDVTLRNGRSDTLTGALYLDTDATLVATRCAFVNNTAFAASAGSGEELAGALLVSGVANLTDCTFQGNSASGAPTAVVAAAAATAGGGSAYGAISVGDNYGGRVHGTQSCTFAGNSQPACSWGDCSVTPPVPPPANEFGCVRHPGIPATHSCVPAIAGMNKTACESMCR